MKKNILIISMLFLAIGLIGCNKESSSAEGKSSSGDTITLKLSSAANENSTWQQGALKFSEIINDKTSGKYKIEIYTMDQLSAGNQASGIEMLQTGVTDVHMQDALVWSSVSPKAIVPALPWLLPSYEDVDKYMSGKGGEAIMEALSESGVTPLAIGESGYRQIVNMKRAIASPEDMVGLKIRVPGSNTHVSLMKLLGADPVTMSSTEVYTATQQGTIDGSENTVDLLLSQKTLEVSKYLTMWNYSYDPIYFCVSNKLWNTLNDEEKTIFKEAAVEAMQLQKDLSRKGAEEAIETIKNEYKDLEIIDKLTPEQLAAFKEKSKPIYDNGAKEFGKDLIEAFGYKY